MVLEDRWLEIVNGAMDKHVSRDETVCAEDQRWENKNLARSLAKALRLEGLEIDEVGP